MRKKTRANATKKNKPEPGLIWLNNLLKRKLPRRINQDPNLTLTQMAGCYSTDTPRLRII